MVVVLFGKTTMALGDTWVGVLTAFAAIGIGVGSIAAGRLSGDKVELGLAPIGAIGRRLRHRPCAFGRVVRPGCGQPDDRRLLRRPVCGAAERPAPAAGRLQERDA
jgi:hypothetical protein